MSSMVSSRRQANCSGSGSDMAGSPASIRIDVRGHPDNGATRTPIVRRAQSADIGLMDAPNPSATPTFASRTPLPVGQVALAVHEPDPLPRVYLDALRPPVLTQAR